MIICVHILLYLRNICMQRNQRFSANALKARGDFIILELWVKESERLNGALGNAIKHGFLEHAYVERS